MSSTDIPGDRPWWKDVVGYEVWPKSFKDSSGDGQGDIQGVISKLDYLKDLGIDLIWICPTYKSPMRDFGYDVSDWQDIDPSFGTLADMEQLIYEVHQRDMRIIIDLVVTHTSDQHPWFLESKASRGNPKHDWYIWKKGRPGHLITNTVTGNKDLVEEPTNWRACFGGPAWHRDPERKQYYLHLFLPQEPDLNWENAETRSAIFEAAIGFWLERAVDGFRIDTVNRLSKDLRFPDAPTKLKGKLQPASDYYINGPRSHFYLKEMRSYIENHPLIKATGYPLMLVGELPRTEYDNVLRYTRPESKELSMVFDFDMVKLGGHDNPDEVPAHEVKNLSDGHPTFTLPQFKLELNKVQSLIANGGWGTVFMENHDQCRSINRYATPDPEYYTRAAKLLCLLQTTLSGTQFIYQGQEMGMLDMPSHWDFDDFRDPAARTYMTEQFKEGGAEAYAKARLGNLKFGRDNSRTPVQWTSGPNAGFSTCAEGSTWMGVNGNKDQINLTDQQRDPDSIWWFWKRQIGFRKAYKEIFMRGSFGLLDPMNEKTFTYIKTAADGRCVLVCLNFSDDPQPMYVPGGFGKAYQLKFLVSNMGRSAVPITPLEPWEGRAYAMEIYVGKESGMMYLYPALVGTARCISDGVSADNPQEALVESISNVREKVDDAMRAALGQAREG